MSLPQSAPKRVGRYRLLAPIARGGAATVYLGRSEGIGGFERIVAVKLLHPHLLEDASSQAANEFLEEAKLSARMQHPMIVPVMDVGHSDEGFFLVMDYVDGASLAEISRGDAKIPHPVALRILSDALEGLSAAHEACDEKGRSLGIVHRDFSPQNILVGTDGRTRLTDFGIARATTRAEYTRTGLVKGKVAYMSPEQAEGKPLDVRSDVWAAGVVAWEMFAGRRMYPQMEPMPMMLRIINDPPPRLRKANPELPEQLEEAISEALEQERRDRCPSAKELRTLLIDAMGGESKLASREEVGQFVDSLQIERLDELRAIVQDESRSLHISSPENRNETLPTLSEQSTSVPVESGTFATTSAEMPKPLMTAELERQLTGRKPKHLWATGLVGAVAFIAALALAFGERGASQKQSSANQAVLTGESTPQVKAATEDHDSARPASSPNENDEATPSPSLLARKELTVKANELFQTVTVQNRAIVLPAPAKTATIHLTEEEQNASLSLVAMTKDGRKAQAVASEKTESVTLEFPEQKASRGTLTREKTSPQQRPAAKKPPSDLVASPY